MKKIILTLFLAFSIVTLSAQDLIIRDNQGNDLAGETLVFDHEIDTSFSFQSFEEKQFSNIINNSNRQITVGLKRYEVEVLPGTGDAVCWGATCFGEQTAGTQPVWVVDDSATVAAGDTAAGLAGFVVYHYPNQKAGRSTYRYEFYDRADPNVSVSVFVEFRTIIKGGNKFILFDENRNYLDLAGDTLKLSRSYTADSQDTVFVEENFMQVFNNSFDTTYFGIRRIEANVLSGTEDSICWKSSCYNELQAGSVVNRELNDSLKLTPSATNNTTSEGFTFYLRPNQKQGKSSYTFEVFEKSNPSNKTSMQLLMDVSYITGIQENADDKVNFSIHPNPAKNFVNVEIGNHLSDKENYTIQLRDVLGKNVKDIERLQSNKFITLNTSNLESGIYFLSIANSNKILSTKKLIIE